LLRPAELEDICLYDYVAIYEKTKLGTRRQELRFAAQHAQHDTHGIRKRTLLAVPDTIGPRIPNRDSLADASAANAANKTITDATNYCKSTLLLFRSFRSIDALAPSLPRAQPSIDDDNEAQDDDNEKQREYRRWRTAFDAWQPDANTKQLLDNAQLFYDSQRDAVAARAAQAAVDAAARRAGEAGRAAFEANAGADGDERPNGDVHEALMEHAAERERMRLAQALDDDVAAINNHVKINIANRQPVDASRLDVGALQTAIDAANKDRGVVESNENNALLQPPQQQQHQFNFSTRPLTVQLIDDAASAYNAQFANEADVAVRRAMLLAVPRPTIADIAEAFTLNIEQREAFSVAATAVVESIRYRMPSSSPKTTPTPIRLLIAGAGGCGKSRIIDALRHFTHAWNVPHAIVVTAYTGNAAVLLRGRTVHNAIGMQARTTKTSTTDNHSANLKRFIQSATVFVIDEVSMISLALLHKIDTQLRALRETDQAFGGMSIVFSGDLLQLAPIGGDALWDTTSTRSECVKGRELWRLVDRVVFLRVNMRSFADATYAAALERIRYGDWRDDDVTLINSRLLGANLQLEIDDAAAIVHTNASRCSINRFRRFCFPYRRFEHQHNVIANNSRNKRIALANASVQLPPGKIKCLKGDIEPTKNGYLPSDDEISVLLDADDNKYSNNLSPTSYFYEGQRVMITENIATSLGAANGAQGTIVAIKHADDDSRQQQRVQLIEGIAPVITMCDRLPETVLVELRNYNAAAPICSLSGLPPNVFPVLPIKKTFTTKLDSSSKSLTVKLTQFPLVPTSAITVHKVQGQSLDHVIVTKWRDPKMVSQYPMTAYVTLSRVRTLAGLYITQPLTKADCAFFVPPRAVIDELERLDKLQPPHLRSSDAVLQARRAPAEARSLQLLQQSSKKKVSSKKK
jgi:hypothetical protein